MYKHKDGITLRKIEKEDLKSLQMLKSESWWGTNSVLFNNKEDQESWYERIPDNQLILIGMKYCEKKCVFTNVGVVIYSDIDYISRSLKVSGSVYKSYRIPEIVKPSFAAGLDFAFEMLNMHRVEGEVLEYHTGAQKLEIGYLGFTVEGRKRKSVYKCGRYYDSLIIGMLREEWEQSSRVKDYKGFCNLQFNPNCQDH